MRIRSSGQCQLHERRTSRSLGQASNARPAIRAACRHGASAEATGGALRSQSWIIDGEVVACGVGVKALLSVHYVSSRAHPLFCNLLIAELPNLPLHFRANHPLYLPIC
jgi:hypothetical protein